MPFPAEVLGLQRVLQPQAKASAGGAQWVMGPPPGVVAPPPQGSFLTG